MNSSKRLSSILVLSLSMVLLAACGTPASSSSPATAPANEQTKTNAKQSTVDFPKENIDLIVGTSPGGGFDRVSRLLAPYLEKYLPNNKRVVVKNITGGGWNIGLTNLYRAKNDGYTIGILNIPGNVVTPILGGANYDLTKMEYIGRLNQEIYVLAASKKSGIKTFEDLKTRKGLKVGNIGLASTAGLGSVIAAKRMGLDIVNVPLDGGNEMIISTLQGVVDYVQLPFGTLKPSLVGSDDLTPILVFADERLKELPNVPTVKELGMADLVAPIALQQIFVAPPGVPQEIMTILRDAFQKAMNDEKFKSVILEQNGTFLPADHEVAKKMVTDAFTEYSKYKDLLEQSTK